MSIQFTQFLRPDGERRSIFIDRGEDIEVLAEAFIKSGGWFEAELLASGSRSDARTSLTACAFVQSTPQDVAIEVVPNGPGVEEAVDRLVKKAAEWSLAYTAGGPTH